MRVFKVAGYPKHHYFVKHEDWREMVTWFYKHRIDWVQESSTIHGIGFSIKRNFEWFSLSWL